MYDRRLDEIIRRMEEGAAVVTVNARLSKSLSRAFDNAMIAKGKGAWPSPVIMPLSAWKERLWAETVPDSPLLSGARAEALWEKIVESGTAAAGALLLAGGAAELSYDAHTLLKEYRLKLPDDLYLTEEAKALKRWSTAYTAEVKRLGFVDPAGLSGLLAKSLASPLPYSVVIFAGFDEFTPATRSLIDGIVKCGAKASFWPDEPGDGAEAKTPVNGARLGLIRLDDENEEAVQAARWARSVLRPGESVGIIVPELDKYRDLLIREFRAELDPGAALPGASAPDAFNISLGCSLDNEPLVKSALDALSIGEARQPADIISAVLLSPYFAPEAGERLELARFDAALKEEGFIEVSLDDALRLAKRAQYPERLSGRLTAWINELKDARAKRPASQWALHFNSALKRAGWLNGVKLTSVEYQALKAWNAMLEQFASLDDVLGPVKRSAAVKKIASLAGRTLHQAETPERQVQVLGLLESTGLFFDYIRMIGCHEYALPGQPRPNPFIPYDLQRLACLPHSSHEREAAFVKRALKRLMGSCKTFGASWPAITEGKEAGVSPLFRQSGKALDASASAPIAASNRLKDALAASRPVEYMPEEEPVPVSAVEAVSIRGGTSVIKDQSLCPFKAFAAHRLCARDIKTPELGLPPDARGTVVHRALKLFWEKVKGAAELRRLSVQGELEPCVKDIVEKAFAGIRVPAPLSFRFMELEKERVSALIMEWMNEELKRGEFTVKSFEKSEPINLHGLVIEGRIDRVDAVESGREAIVDYKTGEVNRNDWLGDRPQEPQLMVYSLTGKYDAVSFARLTPGECMFIGISKAEDLLPGLKPFEEDKFREKAAPEPITWDELMARWKATIEALAGAFMAGHAEVDPFEQKKTCRYCGFTPLCRIAEAGLRDEDENG